MGPYPPRPSRDSEPKDRNDVRTKSQKVANVKHLFSTHERFSRSSSHCRVRGDTRHASALTFDFAPLFLNIGSPRHISISKIENGWICKTIDLHERTAYSYHHALGRVRNDRSILPIQVRRTRARSGVWIFVRRPVGTSNAKYPGLSYLTCFNRHARVKCLGSSAGISSRETRARAWSLLHSSCSQSLRPHPPSTIPSGTDGDRRLRAQLEVAR
jgi:hypothetical protein